MMSSLTRREFLQILAAAAAAGLSLPGCQKTHAARKQPSDLYELPPFGNLSLLHFTDCHAQLLPTYFREPNINIGVSKARGEPPHLVGEALLKRFGIKPGSIEAHAFTYLGFEEAAQRFGKVGGFAHLATLVKRLREQRPDRTLLLDGGDTWQGSATALWTKGQDMVDACKLLGVDIMTAHWEFTYGVERVLELVNNDLKGHIAFLAQNVWDISFGDERVFNPYMLWEVNGILVAVIGQAYPYTPIANPRYMFPEWSFGVRDDDVQALVSETRAKGAELVVVLSHNGMDVDLKMASRVTGIDVIMGGHTHDGIPAPSVVTNAAGKTLVISSGSNGKFLSVLDMEVKGGKLTDYRFRLLPVFSELLPPDKQMATYIAKVRAPYEEVLNEKLAVTETLLYRRGNFNGTFDQLILDAMMEVQGADLAFSPGFRWGTTLLPGDAITMERLMDQTAITYGTATLTEMTGTRIKTILEGIADNLYHKDPYYQQGGDMVRVGALKFAIDPTEEHGKRLSDLELNGKPLNPNRKHKVAGWASVRPQPAGQTQIWDVVADYLRDKQAVRITNVNVPKLKGVTGNPGYAPV